MGLSLSTLFFRNFVLLFCSSILLFPLFSRLSPHFSFIVQILPCCVLRCFCVFINSTSLFLASASLRDNYFSCFFQSAFVLLLSFVGLSRLCENGRRLFFFCFFSLESPPQPLPPPGSYMVIELKEQRTSWIAHSYRLIIVFLLFSGIATNSTALEASVWYPIKIQLKF